MTETGKQGGGDALSVRDSLLTRARNLERYPFESATMAEAGRLAARHLREAVHDELSGTTALGSAVLAICEGEDSDARKVQRIWKLAAQESALPTMHTKAPKAMHDDETCTVHPSPESPND